MAGVVFSIIVVFILEFRSTSRMQTGSIRRECAVRIDDECVTPKDYFAEFGLIVPRGVSQKQIKAYSLRKHVLDGVIERELLFSEAERLGLSIDEEAVKDELRQGRAHASLPAASALRLGSMLDLVSADENGISRDMVRELPVVDPKTGEVDDDLYARVVRSMTNRSPKEFLKMQERELLAARLRDLVRAPVRVSDDEAFDVFQRDKSKAVIRFVKVDSDWFAKWAVDSSDAAIDRWSRDHKSEVDEAWKTAAPKWKAGCPLASEIVETFAPDATEADKTLLKDKIVQAKSRIDRGEPFGVVARDLSDGPSAFAGGQLGCLTPESYGPGGNALARAAATLTPGSVSPVIETASGYHLIRVDSVLAAGDVVATGRRSVARPLALHAAGEVRAKEFATELVRAAQGGARLDDTVAKLNGQFAAVNVPVPAHPSKPGVKGPTEENDESGPEADEHVPRAEISAPFNVEGEPVPGAYGVPVGRMAFDLSKPDEVRPEPISIMGGFLVIQLKEKTAATRDDFASAKADVIRQLVIAKQADALTRYVARLRQAQQGKIDINDRILEEPKAGDQD